MAPEATLRPTTGPRTAQDLATQAADEGFEVVVAAGGDGTVSEIVHGLGRSQGGFEAARLGVLPLGTVNVFAKEAGLPEDLAEAWATVLRGRETRFDVPQVEYLDGGRPARTWFVQMAGAGLDSRSVEKVSWKWKQRTGVLAYIVAGVQAKLGPLPPVAADGGGARKGSGELVLIGNGRFYGGRFPVFPQASPYDGLLDVRVFPRASWPALARAGWSWLAERPFLLPGEIAFQCETVTLSCESPTPFELDGDNVGRLPATFSVRRQALRVMVPPNRTS